MRWEIALAALCACSSPLSSSGTSAKHGVVFTYPVDGQVDVPLGSTVLVTLSDPVDQSALACSQSGAGGGFCLVGPDGPVTATPAVSADGKTVSYSGLTLEEGAKYAVYIGSDLAPSAENLPAGPVTQFTARSERPKAAPPALVAVNGGDPANPESFRPMLLGTTIELLFSEPLDARTVGLATGQFGLFDASGSAVPATILTDGIHVAIDPDGDLSPDTYTVSIGAGVLDRGGQAMSPTTITLTPHDDLMGAQPIPQVLRTRGSGDPGTASPRFGVTPNAMAVDSPLIGSNTTAFTLSTLAAQLGNPASLGGPIAFSVPRGQRLESTGMTVQFGGQIPAGLSTGDIFIEFLTDGGGRLYRNPHQDPDQSPDNDLAPIYTDFALDVGVFAVDPKGNATLTQTVLGVQAAGLVDATDGVMDIETFGAMDLELLGVASAPVNLDLELITDPNAAPATDTTPPTLLATYPSDGEPAAPIDGGVELIFSEPVDLERLRNGGVVLSRGSAAVPAVIESHGAAVVVRPTGYLSRNTQYTITFDDVADNAGNALAQTPAISFTTENLVNASPDPVMLGAVHPGVPCALTGASDTSPGRCASGQSGDDVYQPFTLSTDQPIEALFTSPPVDVALGSACNAGAIRVEQLDATGACVAPVPGTLLLRDRSLAFVPDTPWTEGTSYRFVVASNPSTSGCSAGAVCSLTDAAALNTDPLAGIAGAGAGGGAAVVIPFTAVAPAGDTYVLTQTSPFADLNGNGLVDSGEQANLYNYSGLEITDYSGVITDASFDESCPNDNNTDCMYLSGAMPTQMMPLQTNCTLPDAGSGSITVPACIPVALDPEVMYATSIGMSVTGAFIASFDSKTGTSVMRLRQPADGPITGYIYDGGGGSGPQFIAPLSLYLDAPDLSDPITGNPLMQSKPISVVLTGPVTFLPDGRIQIAVVNANAVSITISTSAGDIDLAMPAGDMSLQVISKPLRGGPP